MVLGLMVPLMPVGVTLRVVAVLMLGLVLMLAWLLRSRSRGLPARWVERGLLLTVALSILWPRFIFFPLGGAYTNPQAASILVMLAVCVVLLVANARLARTEGFATLGLWRMGWLILAWFAWRFVSSVSGDNAVSSTFLLLKELAYLTSFIGVAALLLGFPDADRRLLRVIVFCGFLALLYGLVEALWQKNPLMRFAAGSDNEATADVLRSLTAEKIREGAYRAQSVFTHPIVFAQFVAALLPLGLLLALTEKQDKFWRLLGLLVIPVGLAAIVKSGSRAGFVSVLAAVAIVLFVFWLRALRGRGFGRIFAVLGGPVFLLAAAGIGWLAKGLVLGRSSMEAGSTSARVEMLNLGMRSLEAHPLLGYGEGMSVMVAGLTDSKGHTSVDSYLLSLAVDGGYPSLLLYLAIVLTFFVRLAWLAASDPGRLGLQAGLVTASLMALVVSFIGLTIAHNMTLFWLLLVLGLFYGRRLQAGGVASRP
ncbi:O-antigen ligase family protein [Roseateles sp. LKC17W]